MAQRNVWLKSLWQKIGGLGSRPESWLAALLLWTLVSAGRSIGTPWAAAAGTELLRWGAGIGLALALGGLLRRTEIAGPLLVLLTAGMALLGILGGTSAAGDLLGPYRDHQLYGSVLLLLLPFCAAAGLSAKSASWRWGSLAALTAGTLCLFLSETRSAWIGCGVSALVFAGASLRQLSPRPLPHFLPKRAVFIPFVLLGCGLAGVWLTTSPEPQKAALSARTATLSALGQDESWQSRLALWHGTARLVAAQPAVGLGLGRYPASEWAWTHTGGLLAPTERPSLTNEAHSFYGQTAAEMGLTGLALYLAVLLTFAGQAVRRLRGGHRRRASLSGQTALVIAALSALAGQSTDALASPSWQFPGVSFFFWAVLGLGLASLRRETAPEPVPASHRLQKFGRWALSGGLSVLLATQILPLGLLLTPVEAYTPPAGYTLSFMTFTLVSATGLSATHTITGNSVITMQAIATYKGPGGAVLTSDVTGEQGISWGGTLTSNSGPTNVAVPKGIYVVPTSQAYGTSSKLVVSVDYTDPVSKKTVSGTVLGKGAVYILTVQFQPPSTT